MLSVCHYTAVYNSCVISVKNYFTSLGDRGEIVNVHVNNNGPSMDPWGTPYDMSILSDVTLSRLGPIC